MTEPIRLQRERVKQSRAALRERVKTLTEEQFRGVQETLGEVIKTGTDRDFVRIVTGLANAIGGYGIGQPERPDQIPPERLFEASCRFAALAASPQVSPENQPIYEACSELLGGWWLLAVAEVCAAEKLAGSTPEQVTATLKAMSPEMPWETR